MDISVELSELLDLVKSYGYIHNVSVESCIREALEDWLLNTGLARTEFMVEKSVLQASN